MKPDHDVLTLPEAAEFLRLHENTMLRLAKAKRIPAKKVGARWRFSRVALEKYIGIPTKEKAA